MAKGLQEIKLEGFKLLEANFSHIPAVKRNLKKIKDNNLSKMQYGNALHLSELTGIDLNDIIVIS